MTRCEYCGYPLSPQGCENCASDEAFLYAPDDPELPEDERVRIAARRTDAVYEHGTHAAPRIEVVR